MVDGGGKRDKIFFAFVFKMVRTDYKCVICHFGAGWDSLCSVGGAGVAFPSNS